MKVTILTSGHWEGDPRLNRHVRYLNAGNFDTSLRAFDSKHGRVRRFVEALSTAWRSSSDVLIFPDPELFVLGALIAKTRRKRVVIDIHEDYAKAVASRRWIPGLLKPISRLLARWNDALGRRLADVTVVAADELATPGAVVVLNIPNPGDFKPGPQANPTQVVYVGDVTEARGALEMAELAHRITDVHFLVIGRVNPGLAEKMTSRGNTNLELTGRLSHDEAWKRARGSIAGLSLLRPLPAYMDATATKLWEYAAAGIPPVATDLPGQSRFMAAIDDSLTGSTVDDLVAIVERLQSEEAFRVGVAETARQVVIDAWSESRPDEAIVRAISPDR